MHRLIVVILAAVDAAIAVAVGIAATLAPLTLVWIFGFGGAADWGALWPASSVIWQFGNLVPLAVTIPADYLAASGIDPAAASFTLSLAPLAFAGFTAVFAARSGARASDADAWITGVIAGSVTFATLAAVVALTSANSVAEVELWQALLFPTLVFALPALGSAVVTEWREAGGGAIARLRDRVEATSHGWGAVPGLIVRATAIVVVGLIGLGALLTAVALVIRGGEVIALYELAHLDVVGATVVTLAQLAYLPTAVVWGLAFIAGPGFAVGAGTSVSPAGTQAGVVPGIPLLGIVPDSTTPWLLLLALGPIALGAFAGWMARSRLVSLGGHAATPAALPEAAAATETSGAPTLTATAAARADEDPIGARLVVAVGTAVLAAAGAALLAAVASGSIGPGSLAAVGPSPGPVALAVGLEVILGAGILLLSPRPRGRSARQALVADEAPQPGVAAEVNPSEQVDREPGTAGVDDEAPQDDGIPSTADTAVLVDNPREPFTFPALPRIPDARRGTGQDGPSAPVD